MPNFNVFMHRNNIFRKEPDFKKLASEYKELDKFMIKSSKNNKCKFDFKNPDAVRALTCTLLHRYFQKTILLPPDRLIPAIPQRLNYICWIEDLVKIVERQNFDINVNGLDIGTGASCIFPILACHRNPGWTFVGVEPDEKSYQAALENVERNFMQDRIRVIKITTEDQLSDILSLSSQPVTLIMCNPPFFEEGYGVTMELESEIIKGTRAKSSANSSDEIESITSGGEIAFVGYLLEHSMDFKEDVIIYSSMLGKKQSLIHFKQTLSSLQASENLSWAWAELCQGKTIRYAIAWTFKPGIDLTKAPPLKHGKNKSWNFKLTKKLAKRDSELEIIENGQYLLDLIYGDLMISKAQVTKQTGRIFEIIIKTNERNWTNQRAKRRQKANNFCHRTNLKSSNNNNIEYQHPEDSSQIMVNMVQSFTSDSSQFKKRFNLSSNDEDADDEDDDPEPEAGQDDEDFNDEVKDNRDVADDGDDEDEDCSNAEEELRESLRKKVKYEHGGDQLVENLDDIHDYLLCCRIALTNVNQELFFELKMELPCTASSDGYDLFQYFRNKLREKYSKN